jgi:DNA-binding transcriptional MerR regulator
VATYSIGKTAKITGCKVQTIRYYEQIGLIPEPLRTTGNQRYYRQEEVDRVGFIRHARALGFSLSAIKDILILSDMPDHSCAEADAIANAQIKAIEQRVSQLQALKAELTRMVDHCHGGKVANCRVIQVLADHTLCESHHHNLDAAD